MAGTLVKLRTALKPGVWDAKVTNVFVGGDQGCVELTITSEVIMSALLKLTRSK
jgi:hypothetical protein